MGNSVQDGNVGLAFALVIAAGLSTTIGSALVFFTNLASRRFLASALGASAGVMIYISFAEIFTVKAVEAFEDNFLDDDDEISEDDENRASRYATFSFFGGILVTALLEYVVRMIDSKNSHDIPSPEEVDEMVTKIAAEHGGIKPPCACPSSPSKQYLVTETANPGAIQQAQITEVGEVSSKELGGPSGIDEGKHTGKEIESGVVVQANPAPNKAFELALDGKTAPGEAIKDTHLEKMGVMTAVAIAIHNFPEGLATFVATLEDENLGIAVAIAIALHNIPEGVCVSLPIYYATGKKWKGFLVSFLSGLTEPIGALIGYAVLGSDLSDTTYGLVFGLVAGMMVYISIKELLPNALRYDPDDNVVSTSIVIGMAVMAASLLLFAV